MSLAGAQILVALTADEGGAINASLRALGCRILAANHGEAALSLARAHLPDLALLDLQLPGLDGLTICKELRRDPGTNLVPVFILSPQDNATDRLLAFELGADEFLLRSFPPRELSARVRNFLRRLHPGTPAPPKRRGNEFVVDAETHQAVVRGREVPLTPTEIKLLSALLEQPGQVWTRQRLLQAVWPGAEFATERTVDTHIRRLRIKLGSARNCIRTVRNAGYAFRTL